ncbi:M23 family metallopeptidase [Paenisporosarcina sp. TG-14]|uniref:M23 family metallopeptidase n=1 Tax=Paenisporosarcina sp. TG-14 TaxID=1231057 RepID=UPI0002FB0E5C|nr:M23 family metallopeptidase [Paenisporosarcina sp. TG-14]
MNLKWNTGDRKKISFDHKPNYTLKTIKRAAIITMFASTITFNIGFAKDNESSLLQKVFHIYASEEYVGAVSDEQAVKELVDAKIEETSSQYEGLKLNDESNISVISEQVFNVQTNDTETLDKVDDLVTVATDAIELSVNDEIAVYVKDMEAYHEVVRKLKLQLVSEKELSELEARKDSIDSLPPLKTNETRIVDVLIKESISGVTQSTQPDSVMTVDQAVNHLQKGGLEEKTYTVRAGDVISKIAADHKLTNDELTKLNDTIDDNSAIQIGQELKVTAFKPLTNIEVVREKKETKKIEFKNQVKQSSAMLKGDSKVVQKGNKGAKELTYKTVEKNGIQVSQSIQKEKIIKEVTNNIVLKGTKVIPSRGTGKFSWPAQGGYISSEMGQRWGSKHRGIDIARPSGFTIKAADNGVVVSAGKDGTYGNKVLVDHKNGYQTLYAHLASIKVSVGQTVPVGAKLGVMGSTGRSTGTHLHFEVIKNGKNVNPLSYLQK